MSVLKAYVLVERKSMVNQQLTTHIDEIRVSNQYFVYVSRPWSSGNLVMLSVCGSILN